MTTNDSNSTNNNDNSSNNLSEDINQDNDNTSENTNITTDTTTEESESSSCPAHISDPSLENRSEWTPYDEAGILNPIGNFLFHGNQPGFIQNGEASPESPKEECFYDSESGDLIDEDHPYAGMGGTTNHYSNAFDHTFNDPGGIWESGRDAFATSMEFYYDNAVEEIADAYDSVAEEVEDLYEDSLLEDYFD